MTAKISLFNKGIYKSTLRRYAWGSVLYFIILFVFTGMSIMLTVDETDRWYMHYGRSLILNGEFLIIPLLLSIAVPTVAGLLIFRFIHSGKASVFVHSLPVKREANFISSAFAGLTLMAVPVLLNGIILMLISVCGYYDFFTVADCFIWMLYNFFGIFIMFSAVCFVSSITGNSFAMIVLNILFHTILLVISACTGVVAEMFLYGFPNDNSFINIVAENIFPAIIMMLPDNVTSGSTTPLDIIIPIVVAAAFYIASVILYKNRRIETAEDVAGFKCLNPVFKYLATLTGALVAFAAGYSFTAKNLSAVILLIVIVSALIYFACEMLLKKTFRVWKCYKGYLAFAGVFVAIICLFAFSSFFGYENRIPESARVESVAVYDYYTYEEPFVDNPEIISDAISIHRQMTEKISIVPNRASYQHFHIKYKLKNGGELHRRYSVTEEELRNIMSKLYENPDYKASAEEIFLNNTRSTYAYIYGTQSANIDEPDKIQELRECIKKDVYELSYEQMYNDDWSFSIGIESTASNESGETYLRYINKNINANFKNTIDWIKENGYWDYVKPENTDKERLAE